MVTHAHIPKFAPSCFDYHIIYKIYCCVGNISQCCVIFCAAEMMWCWSKVLELFWKAITSVKFLLPHANIPEPSRLSTLWPGVYSKPHTFFDTRAYLSSSSISSSSSESRVAPRSEPSVLDMKSIGGTGVVDTFGLPFMCLINGGEILCINGHKIHFKKAMNVR